MRRSVLTLKIGKCIETFLTKEYRKNSHLDEIYGGAYYWNERDIHWALYRYLRERMQSHSIGSEWWTHAEGIVYRPKYVRREQWKGAKRADIVLISHSEVKKWYKDEIEDFPPYEAMIEIKLIWRGEGKANTSYGIKRDIKKLESCLSGGTTKKRFSCCLGWA